jgi:hypothetical protein
VTSFGARTQRCLHSAGWSETYQTDVSSLAKALESLGIPAFPALMTFMEHFGGLRLTYPHYRDPTVVDHCHFDAISAADGVFPDRLKSWEARIGAPLAPIGEAFHDHMTLLMTPAGGVYAGMDDVLCLIARSGEAAVGALCEGKEPEAVAS